MDPTLRKIKLCYNILNDIKGQMMTAPKDEAKKVIDSLPEDTTYDEILRELAFDKMIQRGLDNVEDGKVISNEEMKNTIVQW